LRLRRAHSPARLTSCARALQHQGMRASVGMRGATAGSPRPSDRARSAAESRTTCPHAAGTAPPTRSRRRQRHARAARHRPATPTGRRRRRLPHATATSQRRWNTNCTQPPPLASALSTWSSTVESWWTSWGWGACAWRTGPVAGWSRRRGRSWRCPRLPCRCSSRSRGRPVRSRCRRSRTGRRTTSPGSAPPAGCCGRCTPPGGPPWWSAGPGSPAGMRLPGGTAVWTMASMTSVATVAAACWRTRTLTG
jgi:hypothetical protein